MEISVLWISEEKKKEICDDKLNERSELLTKKMLQIA